MHVGAMGVIIDVSHKQRWEKVMKVVLNTMQRNAVSWYFNEENTEGDPWPLNEPVEIEVIEGQLVLNSGYLHRDGEWATFPEILDANT